MDSQARPERQAKALQSEIRHDDKTFRRRV
jgi:hypothetical protein